jgi:peptidoglycan/LPS O-acetylase OafA/YrhL
MQQSQIRPLTGLRWIAALFVYLSHTIGDNNLPKQLLQFSENGYNGVTIFFVLSGFILTVNYYKRLNLRTLAAYFTARAARILPIYYLVLAFVLLQFHIRNGSIPDWSWKHLLLIQVWDTDVSVSMGLNGPAWSIGVEIFFYVLFPGLLFVFSPMLSNIKRSILLTIFGLSIIVLFYLIFRDGPADVLDKNSTHRWLYRSPLTRIGDFVYGIGLGGLYLSISSARRFVKSAAVATYISMILIFSMMYLSTPRTAISWDLQYAVPAGILIVGLAVNERSFVARILGTKVFVQLGEISFAFYLIHKVIPLDIYLMNTEIIGILYYLFNLGLLCCISYSLHHLFEKPARKFINTRISSRHPNG